MSRKVDVLKEIIAAWCERKDIDAVLSHLTEDIEWHYAAVSAAPVRGHAGARKFLEEFGAKIKNPRWRIFNYAETENALFIEGVDDFELESGARVVVPYMGVLEFEEDKIKAWRDYFDRATSDRAAKGEVMPSYVEKLANRKALPELGG